MLQNSRSLLQRTASAIGWWTSFDRAPDEHAPLPDILETIAESAVVGGYSAGIGLGFCLPIKSPNATMFGMANLETNTPVGSDTLFRVGACARQITATAILMLAEHSELRLDDRLEMFLPGEPGADRIRVRDLLIGDSGAYHLLERIIEHVVDDHFANFAIDTLLAPAGMTASRFANPADIMPHRASGYRLGENRCCAFRHAEARPNARDELYATPGDLLLWNRALYSGRLLSRSTVDQMLVAHGEGPDCPPLAAFLSRHGLGFGLNLGRLFGRRAFWQQGHAPGFDAWLFHFPDDRTDLALLANTEQGATTILEPMLRAVLRIRA